MHYGILGMKWGIRRYQNKDGSLTAEGYKRYGYKNLKKARTANMEKWGMDAEHNIVYLTGQSGSGKSTVAYSMMSKGDKAIHIDAYSESDESGTANQRSKEFNAFLDKKVPNWRKMSNATESGKNGSMKRFSKEYWDVVDSFRNAIEEYGREQYKKGHKVVVEGIQIADGWFSDSHDYYKDKPTIVLSTSEKRSSRQASSRDQADAKEYLDRAKLMSKKLDELSNTVDAKRGKKWIKIILKKGGDA